MKEYWLSDNRQYAEQITLYQLIGSLEYRKEHNIKISADEVLSEIQLILNKEIARLNEAYPERA